MEKYKSGKGFCGLVLREYGNPLVVYRIDNDGNPIIDDKEILIIKARKIKTSKVNRRSKSIQISVKGESYQFLRGEILLKDYDEKKSRLSKENWYKLKEIVDRKNKIKNNLEVKV